MNRTEIRRGIRDGLPGPKPYIYRGSDRDTLTGDLSAADLHAAILEHEGPGYTPPLLSNGTATQATAARPSASLCGRPLTGSRAHGSACARTEGHAGQCLSASAMARRSGAARRRKKRAAS